MFTFDRYVTNAPIMNHIHAKGRNSVGDLTANRTIEVSGAPTSVSAWVKPLSAAVRKKFTVAGHTQW